MIDKTNTTSRQAPLSQCTLSRLHKVSSRGRKVVQALIGVNGGKDRAAENHRAENYEADIVELSDVSRYNTSAFERSQVEMVMVSA